VTSKRYIAIAFSLALAGCGPAGKSIGDIPACPEQPLYKFVYDTATHTWTRILVTASDAAVPVSGSAAEDIAKAEGNCITGAGTAESIESSSGSRGSGGSGSSSTGGAPGDAGAD
jgi:hypothetical protein